MISCRFCGTSNAREETRCFRCGRRLHPASARPVVDPSHPPSSTVHDMSSEMGPPPASSENLDDSSWRGMSDGGGGGAATRMARYPETPADPPAVPALGDRNLHRAGLPGEGDWGSLSFQHSKEQDRAPESDIYTNDHVAPLSARIMAGLYDALVMAGAFLVMFAAYAVMTRNLESSLIPESPAGWAIYGILMMAVIVFYRTLFILAGGDSPGTRWAGLRLVTFDGDSPTLQDRFMRVAWGAFSALPLGLGLLWALVDQEKLTWHDLLSKTFPSPDSAARNAPRWSR